MEDIVHGSDVDRVSESDRSAPLAVTGVEAAAKAANMAPNRLTASTKLMPHVVELR